MLNSFLTEVGRPEELPDWVFTVIDGRPDQLGRHLVLWPDRRSGHLGANRIDDAVTDDGRGPSALRADRHPDL